MPRKRHRARIPTPAWERPRGTLGSRLLGRSGQFYGAVVVAVLIVAALGVVGYAFLNDYIEKQQRPGSTAIQVEDKRFRLDYFSDRLKMFVAQSGGQGVDATQQITALNTVSSLIINEELVRRFADELEVSASEDEIKQALATRLGITLDDENFEVAFQQELTRSNLSEQDYRDMVRAAVLGEKVREKLAAELPESAESVRYRQILVSTSDAAQEIRDELAKGADFADLVTKRSLDTDTKDKGGEVDWTPRGVLDASMEELIFALKPKALTNIPAAEGVYVIEMLEKDPDRAIDESRKQPLAARAYRDWLAEKEKAVKIVNSMTVDGDVDKIRWAIGRAYQS